MDRFMGSSNAIRVENLTVNWDRKSNRVDVSVIPPRTVSPLNSKRLPPPLWPLLRLSYRITGQGPSNAIVLEPSEMIVSFLCREVN